MSLGYTPGRFTDPEIAFEPFKAQIDKCFEFLDVQDTYALITMNRQITLSANAQVGGGASTFLELYETAMSNKIYQLQPEDISTVNLVALLDKTFGWMYENLKGYETRWLYIDWNGVKNPRLLAAVFYLSSIRSESDGWLTTQSIRQNIADIAFEGGVRLAELEIELTLIEQAKRGVRLVHQLPKMAREIHHYRLDSPRLEMIERQGGVDGLLDKGVDGLKFCESLVSDLDHANLRHFVKMYELLDGLIVRLKFEDKISESQIHKLMNRVLPKLVKSLGKQTNGGRYTKGCPEMVNALMSYVGVDQDLESYIILGAASGRREAFQRLKLDTVLSRVAFRKRQRTSKPFDAHPDIIQILGVEGFYSQAELHRLNPVRGLLWRLVYALEEVAKQSTEEPEYAVNLKASRELLESAEPMTSAMTRLGFYLRALSPYAPATMSEASFIYMSFLSLDQPIAWHPDLAAHLKRAAFRKALREIMTVEHHMPIIKNLGVESFFGAREINLMKGAHLTDALGL